MMLLSLHLTDLNQRKEIERLRFVFRWTNFQHVLLLLPIGDLSKFKSPNVLSQWRPKWLGLGELR